MRLTADFSECSVAANPRVPDPRYFREWARQGKILNMIYGRANAQVYGSPSDRALIAAPTVVYFQHTSMEIALEWGAVVLILLFVVLSTLLVCLTYRFDLAVYKLAGAIRAQVTL